MNVEALIIQHRPLRIKGNLYFGLQKYKYFLNLQIEYPDFYYFIKNIHSRF